MNLTHEIADYAADLETHIRRQSLPEDWFYAPDHIAVKSANPIHFEALIKQIKKGSLGVPIEGVVRAVVDNRRIDTLFLAGSLAIGKEWEIELVEVMEPRPEKTGKDKVGVDHMEFYKSRLKPIERYLLDRGVIPDSQPKTGHNTLSILFGPHDDELKFTDNRLARVIEEELREGSAYKL